MTLYILIDILVAYVLDLIFGDPYWMPHPVRFIGWVIKKTEGFLRKKVNGRGYKNHVDKEKAERVAGVVLTVFVVASIFLLVLLILKLAELVHPAVFHIVNIYFIYSALAAKCLAIEAKKVYDAVVKKDICAARERLSMLVGRDTEQLNEEEIIRGVVETTAENTVDGIISPLFFAAIGAVFGMAAPLIYAFKAVSTLDSMVGYMNEKYTNFGRASAKLDDYANYIPARISGLLIPISAFLYGKGFRKSFFIMLRDRRNHKSPNCAYPEAAVAGALGVRLGGNNIYFGKVVEKPTIGDSGKKLEARDITDTIRLMYIASFLALTTFVIMGTLLYFCKCFLQGYR